MSRAASRLRTILLWNLSLFLSTIGLVSSTQLYAQEILVAAASDLAPAVQEITEQVEKNQKLTIRFSVGSSGQLARQIQQGAPFHLFLSADETFVTRVVATGQGDASTVQVYAVGRLALWSKSGTVRRLEDLAKPDVQRIAIANPQHAPYGRLAKEALERAGLWTALQPKLVLAETVRQTMQFAGTGNVDAALTSWTLVHDRGGVLLPDSLRQTAVVLKNNGHIAEAKRVLAFLRGPVGEGILGRHGLLPAGTAGKTLLENLQNHDGDGKSSGADKQAQKSERLRPAKKRNKNK